MASKVKKTKLLKKLENEEDSPGTGDYFNCYTDNYLIHVLGEKSYMTQWFVDNETFHVEMDTSIIYRKVNLPYNSVDMSALTSSEKNNHYDGFPKKHSTHVRDKDFVTLSEFKKDEDEDNIESATGDSSQILKLDRKLPDYVLLRRALSHNFPG